MQDSPGKLLAYWCDLQLHTLCAGKPWKREDCLNFCSYLDQWIKNKVYNKSLWVFRILSPLLEKNNNFFFTFFFFTFTSEHSKGRAKEIRQMNQFKAFQTCFFFSLSKPPVLHKALNFHPGTQRHNRMAPRPQHREPPLSLGSHPRRGVGKAESTKHKP